MFLIILVCFLTMATKSFGDTKVWMHSIEISDPRNWIDGKIQEDCNGLVFSEYNDLPAFIKNLRVRQLVLPRYGTIRFEEGSTVLFDEESRDVLNCVKLIPLLKTFWYDYNCWKNLDNPDNPAVPLAERPPCRYDDVVLPKGFNSSISFTDQEVPVKSVTFGNEKLTQNELNALIYSEAGEDAFPNWFVGYSEGGKGDLLQIKGQECSNPKGCSRVALTDFRFDEFLRNHNTSQCSDDLVPMGNLLEPICGAQIIIYTLKGAFRLKKINDKLKEYSSYTHASIYFNPKQQLQIIFTEKQFTGSSLIEAQAFYSILREDPSYFCEDIILRTSGPPLSANASRFKNAVSIIFGTLLAVVVTFGLLFLVYSPTVGNLNLRNRLLSTRPLSTYILHYDNIEDRANIIDGQSLAGSVLALNRSFENPLYEQTPSTRSTSNETVALPSKSEDDERSYKENTTVLDSAKDLEDIDLRSEESDEKGDVPLKDF